MFGELSLVSSPCEFTLLIWSSKGYSDCTLIIWLELGRFDPKF